MKPPRFEYARPADLGQALAMLAAGGPDARLLAGGQSLVPAMNFRLAAPSLLIDLNRIASLRGLRRLDDGSVAAGAMTRHADFETSTLVRESLPLLHAAMPGIAHPAIRSRGTIGGSLAHADPAADWPALCMACDARFSIAGRGGMRTVGAADFQSAMFTTALLPGEALAEIVFPAWPAGRRWSLKKMSRRRGDFALAGVVCIVDASATRECARARIVVFGVADAPRLVHEAAAVLEGHSPAQDDLRRAARIAAAAVPARADLHAGAQYRSELVEALTYRALLEVFHG